MLFRQLFLDAISRELNGVEYCLKGDSFYIYRREIGVVICIAFDVFSNGSEFYIGAGATDFSSSIEVHPNGQLSVRCYDVNEYAPRCGYRGIDNRNVNPENCLPQRYSKSALVLKIQENVNLLRNTLLKELLGMQSLEDYYSFRVRADALHHTASIPFPTIDAFFLCISLDKFREAGHVYRMMLQRRDRDIFAIDECIRLNLSDRILRSLDEDCTQVTTNRDAFLRLEREGAVIEGILNEHRTTLLDEAQRKIARSRAVCDTYFLGGNSI